MHNHCINKLLNLKEVIIKKIIHTDSFVKIMLETKPKEHRCPICGKSTRKTHDYRVQTIKDSSFSVETLLPGFTKTPLCLFLWKTLL